MRDRYKQEPRRLIAITFLLGALAILPATLLEFVFQSPNPLLNAFLPTAIVEESVKFAAVRAKAYSSPSFGEPIDGIVYGVTASLGFATVENIFYVLGFGAISTAIFRAFLSVPSHAAYGGIMGYYVGSAKTFRAQHDKKKERKLICMGVAIAIILHGIFDGIAFSVQGVIGLLALMAIVLLSWLILTRLIKGALPKTPGGRLTSEGISMQAPRFCTACGVRREAGSIFCVNCGQPFSTK